MSSLQLMLLYNIQATFPELYDIVCSHQNSICRMQIEMVSYV